MTTPNPGTSPFATVAEAYRKLWQTLAAIPPEACGNPRHPGWDERFRLAGPLVQEFDAAASEARRIPGVLAPVADRAIQQAEATVTELLERLNARSADRLPGLLAPTCIRIGNALQDLAVAAPPSTSTAPAPSPQHEGETHTKYCRSDADVRAAFQRLDAFPAANAESDELVAFLTAAARGRGILRPGELITPDTASQLRALVAPTDTRENEGEKPKPDDKPDGPFDADGFRFAGVEVKFGRAGKQYCLVKALWDAKKKRPAAPRPVEDVITEVWGDENRTEDSTFRQLCADTRRRFQTANCPLDIQQTNGKVQLSRP